MGGAGEIESVNGGLLNGEEITLAGFELVEDLLSSSPLLLLSSGPIDNSARRNTYFDTTACYSSS